MQARMAHPVKLLPDSYKALNALGGSIEGSGLPKQLVNLVYLRASQINGCSVCIDMHSRDLKKDGESDEVWSEAAGHFDETELAGLLMAIANVNAWNRLNAAIRLVAGVRKG